MQAPLLAHFQIQRQGRLPTQPCSHLVAATCLSRPLQVAEKRWSQREFLQARTQCKPLSRLPRSLGRTGRQKCQFQASLAETSAEESNRLSQNTRPMGRLGLRPEYQT